MQPVATEMEQDERCQVCRLHPGKYTCPQCTTHYCSLGCYRRHSSMCTEAFYRSHAQDQVQHLRATAEDKHRMEEVLLRLQATGVDEDDTDLSISDENDDPLDILSPQTVATLLQQEKEHGECELSWDSLSVEERQRFMQAVAAGHLDSLVQPWVPWWQSGAALNLSLRADGTRAVQPVTQDEIEEDVGQLPGLLLDPLPPLCSLTRATPSSLLKWHALDVLYSYCLVMRLYNGDVMVDIQETIASLLSSSPVLADLSASSQKKTDMKLTVLEGEALCHELVQRSHQPGLLGQGRHAADFNLQNLQHVAALLVIGRPAVICALSHTWQMASLCMHHGDLHCAGNGASSRSGSNQTTRVRVLRGNDQGSIPMKHDTEKRMILVERKLWFLLVWANEQPEQIWVQLAAFMAAQAMQRSNHADSDRTPADHKTSHKGVDVL